MAAAGELAKPVGIYRARVSSGKRRAGYVSGPDTGGAGLCSAPAAQATPEAPPAPRTEYADRGLWDARYSDSEGTFDWYATYKELEEVFDEFCPPKKVGEVLMVGCGNSELSGEMHAAGYKRIMNIDISEQAVEKMADKYRELQLEWQAMDAMAMTFPDDRFDLAIDKGTVDAMMCGSDGHEAAALCAEVYRTLRPGGIFMLVSHNGKRQELLDASLRGLRAADAHWERLDVRRNRLSPQAMFINVLRSMLNGRPMTEAFKDPEMLKEATAETRKSMKQMAFLEVFRLFKAKKARKAAEARERAIAAGEPLPPEPPKVEEDEEPDPLGAGDPPSDPRRQPFCWVYVMRKPAK